MVHPLHPPIAEPHLSLLSVGEVYAEHPDVFPKEKLEWAVKMVQEKEAKVESTAIRQMREEVENILIDKND